MKINRNWILALFIIALSSFVLWQASLIPTSLIDLAVVDAAFLPQVIAVLLLVLVLFVIWDERKEKVEIPLMPTVALKKVLLFIIIMIVTAASFRMVGFEVASIIMLALTMYLLGMRNRFLLVALPLSVTALIHVIFIRIMYVPLPSAVGTLF